MKIFDKQDNSEKTTYPSCQVRDFDQRAPNKLVSLSRGLGVGWLRGFAFLVLDATLVSLAWKLAQFLNYKIDRLEIVRSFQLWGNSIQEPGFLLPILVITLGTILAAGLYGERYKRRRFSQLIKSLTLAQIVLILITYLYKPGVFVSRSTFLLGWFFSIIFVLTGRLIAEQIITSLRHRGKVTRKIFLIGSPQDTLIAKIALKLVTHQEFQIIGQIDLSLKENYDRWPRILEQISEEGVGEVFVCSWQSLSEHNDFYWSLKTLGIHMRFLPVGLNISSQVPHIEMIGGMPTIKFSPPAIIGSDFFLKRAFDFTVAATIAILASPLLLIIAIAIKIDDPGPIFYKQTRVGLRGRHFKVWKFRTMVVNADQLMKELEAKNEIKGGVLFKMKDDPRITKVGKFLRRYSLDELPQLINVLIGEMSLVGPRPLPLRDVEGFKPHHFARQNVLPGITGLWQVSGRSNILNFENAFRLDMIYINDWSLLLDTQILFKTVKVVLGKEGAY
jgi:exopolysaccharide biosynthesis polyprenyl glycosylphosphotransferase